MLTSFWYTQHDPSLMGWTHVKHFCPAHASVNALEDWRILDSISWSFIIWGSDRIDMRRSWGVPTGSQLGQFILIAALGSDCRQDNFWGKGTNQTATWRAVHSAKKLPWLKGWAISTTTTRRTTYRQPISCHSWFQAYVSQLMSTPE